MPEVTGTWESGGERRAGTWQVYLPVRLTDAGGNLVHPKGVYDQGNLVTTGPAPALTVELPATDDPDLSPQDYQWRISIRFASGGSETYVIPVTDDLDLSDVVLPQTIPTPQPVLIRGVPGGIAELDADGDVIDADGNKVTSAALDADLTAIGALAPSNDDLIQRKAGAWTNRTPAQVKTDLALTKTDVGLANVDNTSDANKPVSTATQTALDAKQASDADLTAVAGLSPSNDDLIQRKAGAWTNRTPAQLKTDLVLVKGDVGLANVDNTADAAKPVSTATQTALDGKQVLDSDLSAIAGLTATTDNFLQAKASAWASRTVAQVKTDLALTGTNSGDQTSIVGITGTKAQFDTAVSDGDILYVGDVTQYTDEAAQDAVGAMLVDTATIDLTYTDATPELKADVKDGSVTYAKLQDVSATSRILGRITAGSGDVEELTAANVRTLISLLTDLNCRLQMPLPNVNDWINQTSQLDISSSPPANGELWAGPLFLPAGSYDKVAFNIAVAGSAGALMKVVMYTDSGNRPTTLALDSPTADVTSTGIKEITLSSALVVPAGGQLYWAGTATQGTPGTLPQQTRVRFSPFPIIRTVASPHAADSMAWITSGVTGAAPATPGTSTMVATHTRLSFRRSA